MKVQDCQEIHNQKAYSRESTFPQNHEERVEMFVGGLDPHTTAYDLESVLSELAPIKDLKVMMRNGSTHLNQGFAFFVSQKSHLRLFLTNQLWLNGRIIQPQLKQSNPDYNKQRRVFVGGLPSRITNIELFQIFSRFGEVRAAYPIKDVSSGLNRGFGFIDFISKESSLRAIAKMNIQYQGRSIEIRPFTPKEKRINGERDEYSGSPRYENIHNIPIMERKLKSSQTSMMKKVLRRSLQLDHEDPENLYFKKQTTLTIHLISLNLKYPGFRKYIEPKK